MWTCNICFKTFNRSTSYYNHRRSHKFNYEISSSEHESSSDEESSKEISSDQLFSKSDDVYNRNDGDDGKESNESDENTRIAFDDLSVPIIEHSVVHYKLSNNVGDAFFKFLHIHANFPKRTLPPSTRIGLQFLDNLKKKHTLFNSIPIININNIQYNFEYWPILSGIEEIVSNAEIAEELVFDYNEIWINQEDGQKCSYSEMFNCNWWKQAVNHAPYSSKIVPIIFYSDATTLDHFGKSSRHPIF
ncbi:hypothetical protein RhiirB3_456166, partial [Rhizophagus irregularis]